MKPLLGWQRYKRAMLTTYRSLNHYHASCYDALQAGVQLQVSRAHRRWHVDESLTFNSWAFDSCINVMFAPFVQAHGDSSDIMKIVRRSMCALVRDTH